MSRDRNIYKALFTCFDSKLLGLYFAIVSCWLWKRSHKTFLIHGAGSVIRFDGGPGWPAGVRRAGFYRRSPETGTPFARLMLPLTSVIAALAVAALSFVYFSR